MKRARSDSLTGGTKDVNPQFISGIVTETAANTFTSVQIALPVVRPMASSSNKTTIVEFLKIYCDFPDLDLDAAAATSRLMVFTISTVAVTSGTNGLDNTRVIMRIEHSVRNAFTAAGSAMLDVQNNPRVIDLTDGAGHGVLVATDSMFVAFATSGFTAATSVAWKVLYRFKDVGLTEYIGIVQSQQ